jgi:hypothetical protein
MYCRAWGCNNQRGFWAKKGLCVHHQLLEAIESQAGAPKEEGGGWIRALLFIGAGLVIFSLVSPSKYSQKQVDQITEAARQREAAGPGPSRNDRQTSKCQGTNYSTWNECKGTQEFDSGARYVGEFRNGKRHGRGVYTWPNGDKYVGNWEGGKRNGQGVFTGQNGIKYIGSYQDGKRHGVGTTIFPDGKKYAGEWENGKKNGRGTWTFPDGTKQGATYIDGESVED